MEYAWYIIAALGAGIGTGLAGLSAATVMVPILIVLCPSFAGTNGVYHATAIALASDILGSAFTTGIYIKNKNIDLKRGWVMLTCIVSMCIAGSFAAFAAGNVVLGAFSLFLCVGIGIRFLLKPDTQREKPVEKGAKLDAKGLIISLFFGLTIGFGTGFVGSGGGMMMLVVFTAFLGMDRKPAVGTSTFIMTFTALIAFISHAMIDTSLVFERWDVLLICMVTETAASIVSAQFANKVNNRVVGLVTGAILTVLGVFMLILNYWDVLSRVPLVTQMLICAGKYITVIVPFAIVLIILNALVKIPRDIFRKLLHIPALLSCSLFIFFADSWASAVLAAVLMGALIYPILALTEGWSGYDTLFVQKKSGEVKKSLLILFGTAAMVIVVCWGIFDKPSVAVAATIMWGLGDAAAALVGRRLGKHKTGLKFADQNKTWEGFLAMAAVAFMVGVGIFCLGYHVSVAAAMLYCVPTALAGAYTELISKNGTDTFTVPFVNMVCLLVLTSVI